MLWVPEARQTVAHGVSRGIGHHQGSSPARGDRIFNRTDSFAPMALTIIACVHHPTACAVGYDLALLRSFATDTNHAQNQNRLAQ
jgi:hypothetical protein